MFEWSYQSIELLKGYAAAGRSVIPTGADKRPAIPAWRDYQSQAARPEIMPQWFDGPGARAGAAIIGGAVSAPEGFNLVCVDCDVKYSGMELFERYCALLEEKIPGLRNRLIEETSPSGGRHFWFLSPTRIGSAKLAESEPAQRENPKTGKMEMVSLVWIETKGEGGYAVCHPTPGYNVINGSLLNPPKLSADEVEAILVLAASLTANFRRSEKGKRLSSNPDLPGAQYAAAASFPDMLELLLANGWTVDKELSEEDCFVQRPRAEAFSGPSSARLSRLSPDEPVLLYVYSSSTNFPESMRAYDPFAIRTFVEFGGDFGKCARALRKEGFGKDSKKKKPDHYTLATFWATRFKDEWAWDAEADCWRRWAGSHWGAATKAELLTQDNRTHEILSENDVPSNDSTMKAVVNRAKNPSQRRFVPAAGKINFANGTLLLDSLTFQEFDRADNLTYAMPYNFGTGRYPAINQFLRETMPDAVARRAYMTHVGLAMMQDRRLYKMVVFWGGKRSGKGTCLKLANAACGQPYEEYATPNIFHTDQEGSWSRALHSEKRVAAVDEMPGDALQSEDLIKSMITHEGVAIRGFQEKETPHNAWGPKLIAATNTEPRFADHSGALKERLILINCPNSRTDDPFEADPDRQVDHHKIDRLLPDLPAFASACLLRAKIALQEIQPGRIRGYPTSISMQNLLNLIAEQGDPIKSWVGEECVIEKANPDSVFTSVADLHRSYAAYCVASGYKWMAVNRFSNALFASFSYLHRTHRETPDGRNLRGFLGVSLRAAKLPMGVMRLV